MKRRERDVAGKKLGRGLGALLTRRAEGGEGEHDSERPVEGGGALEVAVTRIVENPDQPRDAFDEQRLKELAESIGRQGVLQPLVVRKGENEGWFELVAGERRLRAAQLAGLDAVPVVVMEVNEERRLEVALVENLQREDLNIMEVARAYAELQEKRGLNHGEIGERVGVSREQVSNTVRLLQLPREVQEFVLRGTLSMGHAKVLLGLDLPQEMVQWARRIVREGFSVRTTERALEARRGERAKGKGEKKKAAKKENGSVAGEVERQVRERLGTKVSLERREKGGVLHIEYYSDEDLARILEEMGIGLQM